MRIDLVATGVVSLQDHQGGRLRALDGVDTMPISGTAGAVMSVTGLGQWFNNVLKNESPPRIRSIVERKPADMEVPADQAKRYLDHPAYTPRHDLILMDSLYRLGGTAGRDRYIENALKAEGEVEANFFVNTAQILRGYHERREPIAGITMFEVRSITGSGRRTPIGSPSTSRPPITLLPSMLVSRCG